MNEISGLEAEDFERLVTAGVADVQRRASILEAWVPAAISNAHYRSSQDSESASIPGTPILVTSWWGLDLREHLRTQAFSWALLELEAGHELPSF